MGIGTFPRLGEYKKVLVLLVEVGDVVLVVRFSDVVLVVQFSDVVLVVFLAA